MDNEETAKGVDERPGDTWAEERSSSPFVAGSAKRRERFWQRRVGPGLVIVIILGVVILRGWFIEGVIVGGTSMAPTLHDGERLLVLKKVYSPGYLPARGTIVIFEDPLEGGIAVKRVIAKPGELLGVYGTQVYVDGHKLIEPYAQVSTPELVQGIVPQGTVWLMGDNRANSSDSRQYGPVRLSAIRGKAVLVMWPPPPRIISQTRPRIDEQ